MSFQEYPKMLYRFENDAPIQKIVDAADEEQRALADGWAQADVFFGEGVVAEKPKKKGK